MIILSLFHLGISGAVQKKSTTYNISKTSMISIQKLYNCETPYLEDSSKSHLVFADY